MAWTDEQKQQAIDQYLAGNPTAENSGQLVADIAKDLEQTPNGVRMVLNQAGKYVKIDPAAKASDKKTDAKEGAKRVSKESQIAELIEAIKAKGAEVDEEILSKLTGKAAAYLTKVLKA